ncbi:MAG: hydroxyisourate hydrolase [Acidimicrobiia bacterium]|nr:hydroxyisourate hydrolase [Acidimicrobiia bacterium]
MSTLTTHVLDTERGVPVSGMSVHVSVRDGSGWSRLSEAVTDSDGRAGGFGDLGPGTYRLGFETGAAGNEFYPFVHVVFVVDGSRDHYHVPLLLSGHGYTTYRGS